jgi:hypothetical protein
MPLGHIAVVTDIVGSREIRVDHANWTHTDDNPEGIWHGISVIDVSERNDWSAVRVGIRYTGLFGDIYPVEGFIYPRRAEQTQEAAVRPVPTAGRVAMAAAVVGPSRPH